MRDFLVIGVNVNTKQNLRRTYADIICMIWHKTNINAILIIVINYLIETINWFIEKFVCDWNDCDMKFVRIERFKAHQISYSKEKDFKCNFYVSYKQFNKKYNF